MDHLLAIEEKDILIFLLLSVKVIEMTVIEAL